MKFIFTLLICAQFFLLTYSNAQNFNESWKLFDDSQVGRIDISVDPADLQWMYDHVNSDSMHVASIHFKNVLIDEVVDSVGIRLRGNTSRVAAKKSFKISFNTYFPGRKFYSVEKLNLNGEHNDPSIIRSKLCWDFFNDIGLTASRAAHFALYINGDYFGLYIMVEHVDENFISANFADDTGNLWKCLYPASLEYRGSGQPQDYYPWAGDGKPYDLKTNVAEYDYSQLARLIDKINNTPSNFFSDSLESILDVPEFIKYMAMDVLLASWDDYWSLMNNYYLYYEPAIDKFHLIPYDYDNTLGIDFWDYDWAFVIPYEFPKVAEGARPLADRIISNAQYRNLFTHFLKFYGANVISLPNSEARIDRIKNLISQYAEADSFRTLDYGFLTQDFHNSFSVTHFEKYPAKYGLKEYIDKRTQSISWNLNFLNAAPIIYNIEWFPKVPQPDDTIHVYASAFGNAGLDGMQIQFSPGDLTITEFYDMNFEPLADTKIVEEADRWHGTIPPLGAGGFGKFRILAKGSNMLSRIYPLGKSIEISTPNIITDDAVINEFMAQNDSTIQDESGEYDDWLELYNPTSSQIILSGKYLTDKPSNLIKWEFPPNTVIEPGEYLLVWCDNDTTQPGLHTNFKLSAGGEFIGFSAEDGISVIDSISFGPQTADISFGRIPDGENFWTFTQPTPGAGNIIVSVKKTEFITSRFTLEQNYPNPFNPSTVIGYQLAAAGHVTLKIFDLLGNEITTLVDEEKPAGRYSATFNSSNLKKGISSGVYIYQLHAGEFIKAKKLMLLK